MFNFTRLSSEIISDRLKYICQKEQIINYEEACDYISRICNNQMRDAISILEKSISYSTGNELSLKTVYDSNSDIDYDSLFSLLDKGILEGNEQIVITTLEDWYLKGIDFNLLVNRFLDFCFDISKYIISNNIQVTKIPSDFLSSLDRVSKFENSITYFNYYIDQLIKLKDLIRNDLDNKLTVEVVFLKMTRLQ